MMSKNSIVPFLKDYLIKFLTRPFLLDTNELQSKIRLLYLKYNNSAIISSHICQNGKTTCAFYVIHSPPPFYINI